MVHEEQDQDFFGARAKNGGAAAAESIWATLCPPGAEGGPSQLGEGSLRQNLFLILGLEMRILVHSPVLLMNIQ